MSIDPRVAVWVNVIVALLTVVSTGGLSLAGIVSPATATQIVAGAGTLLTIINAVMHALSSSTPGPLAPADPPVVAAAQRVADIPPGAPAYQVTNAKALAVAAVQDHQP